MFLLTIGFLSKAQIKVIVSQVLIEINRDAIFLFTFLKRVELILLAVPCLKKTNLYNSDSMSGNALFILLLIITAGVIVTSVLLINAGMRPKERKLSYIRAGWLIIGIYSILATAGLVYLSIESSGWLVMLLLLSPLIILLGLILTLSLGLYYTIEGNKGEGNKKERTIGITCLIINAVIVITVGTLLILFMSGLVPIRLM